MNNELIRLEDHLDLCQTIEGLNKFGNLIALKYWGMELDIPIVINNRLRKSYGRFLYTYNRNKKGEVISIEPYRIEISKNVNENFLSYQKMKILKHELCHWACVKLGKPHGDGTDFFEKEIKRIGALESGEVL